MDRGELFNREFRIVPGRDQSFSVFLGDNHGATLPEFFGFTNVDDLISFLRMHAAGFHERDSACKVSKGNPEAIPETVGRFTNEIRHLIKD
jgi:hypothetical protein